MAVITIQLDTDGDKELIAAFAHALVGPVAKQIPHCGQDAVAEEKPKRTRKNKETPAQTEAAPVVTNPVQAEAVAEEQAEVSASVQEEAPATEAYTLDDVRTALQDYAARTSLPQAIEVLSSFGGATRISELNVEDYAAFIAKCRG